MKNFTMRMSLAAFVAALIAIGFSAQAEAGYAQQGIFGGRVDPQGPINMRNPVEPVDGAQPGISVAERPRPEFDPIPIDIGSFQMFPSLELGTIFDNNIFSQTNDRHVDMIWTVRPAVTFYSNWSRHSLSFGGQGDIAFYTENDDENYSDGILTARGRFDIQRGSYISYGADYQRLTEVRSSPDDTSAAEPTNFNYYKFFGGGYHRQGRFDFKGETSVRRFDFDPTSSRTMPVISLDYRDRTISEFKGEVGYEWMGFWRPFVRGAYNVRDYDSRSLRNSDGYRIAAGTGFELSKGIVTGEIYGGYMGQNYYNWTANNVGRTSEGVLYGGSALWNITDLTSLVLEADRTIEETTLTAYRSYTTTGGSATLTHELMRNLLLEFNADLTHYDFNGAPDRNDDNFRLGGGGRYFFSRNFWGDFEYNYYQRVSTVDSAEYDKHVIAIRLGAQM